MTGDEYEDEKYEVNILLGKKLDIISDMEMV